MREMQSQTTGDGSITFHNPEYDETYHSTSGAIEESFKKFVEPANINQLAKSGKISVLDVCFGLGYNSLAAIHSAISINPGCRIHITALEKDKELLTGLDFSTLGKHEELIDNYKILIELCRKSLKSGQEESANGISLKIMPGDAREEIKKLMSPKYSFDVCFLDPFSPKKCPELWSADFLRGVGACLRAGGILTTYSCASIVRKNLVAAGFAVKDGPCIGRRSPSTIAVKI